WKILSLSIFCWVLGERCLTLIATKVIRFPLIVGVKSIVTDHNFHFTDGVHHHWRTDRLQRSGNSDRLPFSSTAAKRTNIRYKLFHLLILEMVAIAGHERQVPNDNFGCGVEDRLPQVGVIRQHLASVVEGDRTTE